MKKITLLLLTLMVSTMTWAQCTTGGPYQGVALTNDGSLEMQSGCNYTGEYSETSNVIDGDTYTFSSEVGTDYLTVTSSDGVVVYGHGVSPLTLAVDTSGDLNDQAIRVYYHDDAACGTTNACRDTFVRNDTAAANSCFDPTGLTASNLQQTTTDLSWTSGGPSDVDYNVTVFLSGADPMVDPAVFTANNVAGLTVTATGLTSDTAYDAYVIANCGGATAQSGLVGPTAFTTTVACPDPTAQTATGITDISAILGWSQTGSVTAWNIELVDITAAGTATGTATDSGVANPFNQTGLVASNDYEFYVQADCSSTWVGPFAFTTGATPPANDNCSGAIVLTPGAVFADMAVAGDNVGATASEVFDPSIPAPGCSSYGGGDVWYSVTVPNDGNLTIETNGNPYGDGGDTGMVLYSGTCGALNNVECDDDDSADGFYSQIVIEPADGLANQVVYLRIFEYGNNAVVNFEISAFSATLGVNDFEANNSFKFYPNPVSNVLTLSAQSNIENVVISNMLGQEVLRATPNSLESEIDFTALNSGAYFVNVSINGTSKVIRIIKN